MASFKDLPKDFQELMEQSPTLVPHVVRRFLHYSNEVSQEGLYTKFEADYEEYLQETYLFLMSLHPNSIHRLRGCVDRIQVYDDSLCPPGMSRYVHFKKFITEIITRFLQTHRTARFRDAMEQDLHPLEANTIVVISDPTKKLIVDECMGRIADSVVEKEGKLRFKKKVLLTLHKNLGVPDNRKEHFQGRMYYFIKHHFSSIDVRECY